MKKRFAFTLALMAATALSSCGGGDDAGSSGSQGDSLIDASILFAGWINSPADENDPFKKWVADNYGLNMTLMATNDFDSDVVVKFASNNKPDIVVFSSMDSYRKISDQGVLIEDWNPYLDQMPDVETVIQSGRASEDELSTAEKIFTDEEGHLGAIWTTPDPATWSLKIREDWADEFRASDPQYANWTTSTPEDLLNFARWIKENKEGCYGFTSAGSRSSFGTLGNFVSYMFGYVQEVPWGIYIGDDNKATFGVLDGSYKKYLDYVKTIVSEGLIDPSWYEQDWEHKTKTKEGRIGIEWYPGSISEETEMYQGGTGEKTLDWWETYQLPSDGGAHSGYLPIDSFYGNLITVSKKASIDKTKMERICKLLNDVAFHTEKDSEGETVFVRGTAYDALRWGVGVEKGVEYLPIEGTNSVYCNTNGPDSYRQTAAGAGAWDWGAWFSNTGDGVVQGSSDEIGALALKVYEHNAKTAGMPTQVQVGGSLSLDATAVQVCKSKMENYAYKYVTGQETGYATYEDMVEDWKNAWGGQSLLDEATAQFKELGFID